MTKPNGNEIVRPEPLIRPLVDEFLVVQKWSGPLERRAQTVYDFAEKAGLVHDLLERI